MRCETTGERDVLPGQAFREAEELGKRALEFDAFLEDSGDAPLPTSPKTLIDDRKP